MDIVRQLAKRIKILRKGVGLTQEQLAEASDLSTDFIGLIERGERAPSIRSLFKIASALNMGLEELVSFKKKSLLRKDETEKVMGELVEFLRGKKAKDIRSAFNILRAVFEELERK